MADPKQGKGGVSSKEEVSGQSKEITARIKEMTAELSKSGAKCTKEECEKKVNSLLKALKEIPNSGTTAEFEKACQNLLNINKTKCQSEEWKAALQQVCTKANACCSSAKGGKEEHSKKNR